nr:hypothetical protein [Tanacetum cinerariifolium]
MPISLAALEIEPVAAMRSSSSSRPIPRKRSAGPSIQRRPLARKDWFSAKSSCMRKSAKKKEKATLLGRPPPYNAELPRPVAEAAKRGLRPRYRRNDNARAGHQRWWYRSKPRWPRSDSRSVRRGVATLGVSTPVRRARRKASVLGWRAPCSSRAAARPGPCGRAAPAYRRVCAWRPTSPCAKSRLGRP